MRPEVPDLIYFGSGNAEGTTALNAFDNALLEAGIGDLNLVKISSIIPAGVEVVSEIVIEPGSVVPCIYSRKDSSEVGEVISACVGGGFTADSFGILYEYAHNGTAAVAEEIVAHMIEEGFKMRGMKPERKIVVSAEHKVQRIGCALAAALLWWR